MQHAQQLGRYHLLDRVAFGGMAEIYRAKTADAQGRLILVAVKRVLAHLCEDDEFIQMLIDEARLTAMLKHQNIARVYEFCRTPNEYFISMEYVDGKDLRALLEKAKQNQEWLAEEHIAYICMETARGLHGAHVQTDRLGNPLSIVHRDVSPSNVLLSYTGDVKLCDFGIAKASSSRAQTKTGVIKGKVKYMSPEQAMGRKLDHRSDLFSLGTLLYEMLALQAPFTASTEIELLFAVRDARKRPIREIRPHLNADLEIIIERAMAKSRSQRFQTGEEFAAALQAFLDTYYPNYHVSKLARYLQTTFAREREREQRTLDDYIIEGGSSESVGENLLADVLGPDAEYTQFTAAFTQMTAGQVEIQPPSAASFSNAPNPMLQMRVMSSVSMPGIEDIDGLPTMEKQRLSPDEMGMRSAEATAISHQESTAISPSARTQPRALQPRGLAPPSISPSLHADSTAIVGDKQAQSLLADDGLHAQETHILSRDQVEAYLARRAKAKEPEPQSLAAEPELHDASTQILSMNSLPANIREVLQKRVAEAAPQATPQRTATAPSAKPQAAMSLPTMPSLNLEPLEGDMHDAATAYLDWHPVETQQQGELPPPPDPSVVHPARPATRPVAAIPSPRSATGAQTPLAPPISSLRSATSTPPISATPPRAAAVPSRVENPHRSPTGPQPPAASPPITPMPTRSPLQANTPRPTPMIPPTPSGQQLPATPSSRLAPSAPGAQVPASPAPRSAPVLSPPQAPPLAPPPPAPTSGQQLSQLSADEWESLPHLDSTMIARGHSVSQSVERPIERPPERVIPRTLERSAVRPFERATARPLDRSLERPAERPGERHIERPGERHIDRPIERPIDRPTDRPIDRAAERPGSPVRNRVAAAISQDADQGDMPTVPPGDMAAQLDEPVEHTLNTEELGVDAPSGQFDDLPTPIKSGPAGLRDLGIEPQADFAEDTDKRGHPRGINPRVHKVDSGVYLSDDDLEID